MLTHCVYCGHVLPDQQTAQYRAAGLAAHVAACPRLPHTVAINALFEGLPLSSPRRRTLTAALFQDGWPAVLTKAEEIGFLTDEVRARAARGLPRVPVPARSATHAKEKDLLALAPATPWNPYHKGDRDAPMDWSRYPTWVSELPAVAVEEPEPASVPATEAKPAAAASPSPVPVPVLPSPSVASAQEFTPMPYEAQQQSTVLGLLNASNLNHARQTIATFGLEDMINFIMKCHELRALNFVGNPPASALLKTLRETYRSAPSLRHVVELAVLTGDISIPLTPDAAAYAAAAAPPVPYGFAPPPGYTLVPIQPQYAPQPPPPPPGYQYAPAPQYAPPPPPPGYQYAPTQQAGGNGMLDLINEAKLARREAQRNAIAARLEKEMMADLFQGDENMNPYTRKYEPGWKAKAGQGEDIADIIAKAIDARLAPIIQQQEERKKEEEIRRILQPHLEKSDALQRRLDELVTQRNQAAPQETGKIDTLIASLKESQMQTALQMERAMKDVLSQKTGGFDFMQWQQMRMEDERLREQSREKNESLKLQMIEMANKTAIEKVETMMEMMRGSGRSESDIESFAGNLKLMKELGVLKLGKDEESAWERVVEKVAPHVPGTLKALRDLQGGGNIPASAMAPAADSARAPPPHRRASGPAQAAAMAPPQDLPANPHEQALEGELDCPGCGTHIGISIAPGASSAACRHCKTTFDTQGNAYFSPQAMRIREAAGMTPDQADTPVPPGTLARLQHQHGESRAVPVAAAASPRSPPPTQPAPPTGPATRVLYSDAADESDPERPPLID